MAPENLVKIVHGNAFDLINVEDRKGNTYGEKTLEIHPESVEPVN